MNTKIYHSEPLAERQAVTDGALRRNLVESRVIKSKDGGLRSTVEFGIYLTPETSYRSSRHTRYYDRNTRVYRNYYVSRARAQVMLVQSQLIKLGYYSGPIDGIIGRGTRAGLIAFQLDNDIQPTGRINEITLYQLGILR